MPPASASPGDLLAPFREAPTSAALLTDVDGTIAPIVGDPKAAAVLPEARDALAVLAERFALVGCVSGRPAAEARRLVGLDRLVYVGNHGLERLDPGAAEARRSPALAGHESDATGFLDSLAAGRLDRGGLRVEDKGPIRALHWRGAADEAGAAKLVAELEEEAERAGLRTHRGRKVLELRPPVEFDKGIAIADLLGGRELRAALYAGDDRTDLDGFRALRELVRVGALESAVCVGIDSPESPGEVAERADLDVADPPAFAAVLEGLARG